MSICKKNQSKCKGQSDSFKLGDKVMREAKSKNTTKVQQRLSKKQAGCLDNLRWCLPDVNCKARSTMGALAKEAFEENQTFCKRIVID